MFEQVQAKLKELLGDPYLRAGAIIAAALLLAVVVRFIMKRWLPKLTAKTKTEFDDQILSSLERPVFASFILFGTAWAYSQFKIDEAINFVVFAVLKTCGVLVWAAAANRMATHVLAVLSRNAGRLAIVQPRTLKLFQILARILIWGTAAYLVLLSWHINVTAWLASAGIVGVAVGFAAKDTLANLFAGIFILADAPYKIGDFVVLDNNQRGRVTDIGIRSTRILTRDDIEITVPNAVIANAKIVNETAGPHVLERVRVTVEAAYGSDIDQVREVLLGCVEGVDHVVGEPEPRVRFREFAASGLKFQLLAWIEEPVLRGRVLDALHCRVYKAFNEAGIEIPYAKRDVYIKEMPGLRVRKEAGE